MKIIFVISIGLLTASVSCVKINNEKILSNKFINDINEKQNLWRADRNFHINSQLRNIISISFKRRYTLQSEKVQLVRDIPLKFDARNAWPKCTSINFINTQGNCASSYAVVAASVFTDRLCIQSDIRRNSSADQVLTCCKNCGAGCFGGHIERSFMYMKSAGLVTGGGYNSRYGCRPYRLNKCPANKGNLPLCPVIRSKAPSCYYMKCYNDNYKDIHYDKDKLKMSKIYAVPTEIDFIKSEIIRNGPVSATFTVYEDFFSYKSGVYVMTSGSEVGEHDVKIIGWGETNDNGSYWVALNSWGTNWGENGTFRIRSGSNECGIESHILAGTFLGKSNNTQI